METKEDPVKIKAIIKELREVYLELVDYYLSNALNLNDTRRSCKLFDFSSS